VNNALYGVIFLKDGKRIIEIAKINSVILYSFACDLFYSFQNSRIGPAVVINRNNIKTVIDKVNYSVGADIAASPCDKYCSHN
jgi:hypothetical protein